MQTSGNVKVQQLLDDLRVADSEKYHLLQALRRIVMDCCSAVAERVMYGGIMFSFKKDFAGLFVYKKHIAFEFSQGYQFADPNAWLQGKGKYHRHVKLISVDDVVNKQVSFLLNKPLKIY